MNKLLRIIAIIFISFSIISCSKSDAPYFQTNSSNAPFDLFHLFDDYPALKAAWDSVPGNTGNQKMAEMMKDDIPGTAEFLHILSYLLERADSPGLGLLDDMKAVFSLVNDGGQRFYSNAGIGSYYAENSPATHLSNFYGFLDELTRDVGGTTPKVGKSVVSMIEKILPYLLAKSDADLQRYLEELYMSTFYSATDYGGTAIRLREGSYINAQLTAAGIAGIRSIKVPLLYKVTLYASGDLSGPATEYDSSMLDIPAGTGSLKIEKNPKDMTDLAELAAQPLVFGDFPMWIDTKGTANDGDDTLVTDYSQMYAHGTIENSNLGNMASGIQSLMSGLIAFMNGKTVDRSFLYNMISNLNDALHDTGMVERLIWNMSNYVTEGGSIYGTENKTTLNGTTFANDLYNMDIDNTLYSNAELKETLQEMLPLAGGLFRRDDRYSSMVYKSLTNRGISSHEYPLTKIPALIDNLYINWGQTQLKESIHDMIRYDAYGRDRTDIASGAYSAGILEHLLFIGGITSNFGFKHYAHTAADGELGNGTSSPTGSMVNLCNANGHGEYCGFLTLNDSLFSTVYNGVLGMNTYNLLFDGSGVSKPTVCRSMKLFSDTPADISSYNFVFSWDYPVLHLLSGPCAGDMGSSSGGNRTGGGGAMTDAYIPYTANGIETKDLASWTFSFLARTCWEGEGPYYSTQGAQISGNSFTYLRPDGTVYAMVDKTDSNPSNWTYTYPVDASSLYDKADPDDTSQRWNRFKPAWNTDYYLIKTPGTDCTGAPAAQFTYTLSDMSGTATQAGSLTYNEIPIDNNKRECASHEEAIFRNFQWLMNEKKMVLIVPLNLQHVLNPGPTCTDFNLYGYLIIEGNGITGLSMARKFRDNNIWAKANIGDAGGSSLDGNPPQPTGYQSSIPGDYRITILGADAVGGLIYTLLQKGTLTPAAIAQNISALSRLAFPRSPLVTITQNGAPYKHCLLGSQQIDNDGEETDLGFLAWNSSSRPQGDIVWKKRNELIPLLVGLIANLHAKSDATNNGVAKMIAGLQPLIKPLVFFNYDASNQIPVASGLQTNGVAKNCWLPRINGVTGTPAAINGVGGNYRYPIAPYLMPDMYVINHSGTNAFVSDLSDPTAWYGGDYARNYYAPKSIPTLLSILTDSDTSQDRSTVSQRADGLLAKLTTYTAGTSGRPDIAETLAAHSTPRTSAIADILYGLEQFTSGMKMGRAKALDIYEDMSDGAGGGIINIPTKQLILPKWIFKPTGIRHRIDDATKYADIDVEKIINKLKGGDDGSDPNKGLNRYHDTNTTYNDGAPDWTNLTNAHDDGIVDILKTLTGEFLVQGAPYVISENLFDIIDVMYQHNPTAAQIKGALYNIGKLLAYYDTKALPSSKWLLQSDAGFASLYDLLMTSIPTIDNEMGLYSAGKGEQKGATYRSLLHSLQKASADNGLVQFIVGSVSIGQYSSGDVLNELSPWLESDLISSSDTVFYSTMSEMVDKMAEIVFYSPTEEGLYSIYDQYGFQPNQ